VIAVRDSVEDNDPGKRNVSAPLGNAVFIQHATGEVSVLGYLKQGTLNVKKGDVVAQGQVLAQCGSSGNASEPLVHYHLQNGPVFGKDNSIRCNFRAVTLLKPKAKNQQILDEFEHITGLKALKKEKQQTYLPIPGDFLIIE
jgi:murein DD-endopeptidase MepM/ murein hydrolase activator NlpD